MKSGGVVKLGMTTNVAGLIHTITLNGTNLVTATNPVEAVLVDGSNCVYRASRPDGVSVETQGPMRTMSRVSGHFVAEDAPAGAPSAGGRGRREAGYSTLIASTGQAWRQVSQRVHFCESISCFS
jgi:hypothetical protein